MSKSFYNNQAMYEIREYYKGGDVVHGMPTGTRPKNIPTTRRRHQRFRGYCDLKRFYKEHLYER